MTARLIILALAALALLPAPALATDTWVSELGNDLNPCTETQPCASMQRAAGLMSDGGTMRLVGTLPNQTLTNYRPAVPARVALTRGAFVSRLDAKGTWDTTFDGAQQATIRLINLERSTGTGGAWDQRITIRGMTNLGTVRFIETTDLNVEQNLMRDGNTGIVGRLNTSPAQRVQIADNYFDDFEQDAIQINDANQVTITGNLFHDIHDDRASTDPPTCYTDGSGLPNPGGLPSCYHSDAIQTSGGATNWSITHNSITAATNGIILQGNTPAVPRQTSGVLIDLNRIAQTSPDSGPTNAIELNGVYAATVTHNIACGRLNGIHYSPYSTTAVPTDGTIRENLVSGYVEQAPAVADDADNKTIAC